MGDHRFVKKIRLWLFLSLGLSCALLPGAQDKTPLSIGTQRQIRSGILNEERTLSVRLPSNYAKSPLAYPVVYLLYGDHTAGYFAETVFTLESLEGGAEIPDFIVVGIHNTDRYGNLLPVNFGGRPSGADAFMDFLDKELFPFIESEYRTKPYRLLIGPQAGGPFGLYALARRPALFHAFILENPFSAPDSRELLKAKMREYAASPPKDKRSVFINSFDRAGFQDSSEAARILADFLKEFEPIKPAGLEIRRRHLEEPTFVPQLELTRPLRSLFAGHYPPPQTKLGTLEAIKDYYRELGRRLDMDVDPPSFLLTIICDDLIRAGRTAAARELLEYSLLLRPDETNSLFRLGNLYFEEGELDRAEQIFLKLQNSRPDPYFASRLEAIRRMRSGSAAHALSLALKEGFAAAKARLVDLERAKDRSIYFDEREINSLGYRLLNQNRPAEAVFIFELNARRNPKSWNAHDSLGEAYLKAGRKAEAVRSLEESLRLNPDNKNAKKLLDSLRRD